MIMKLIRFATIDRKAVINGNIESRMTHTFPSGKWWEGVQGGMEREAEGGRKGGKEGMQGEGGGVWGVQIRCYKLMFMFTITLINSKTLSCEMIKQTAIIL